MVSPMSQVPPTGQAAEYPPRPPGGGSGRPAGPPPVRRAPGGTPGAPPADGRAVLSLRDPGLWLVLCATAALQAFTWSRLAGYELADVVEYMDRAHAVARGLPLDPGTARSFAYSSLLLPFFLVAEWLGLEDLRGVVHSIRLAQMALAAATVVLTARLGARWFGREAGLACGALLGLNPVFAQYSIAPLTGGAAALCLLLALTALARTEDTGRATFRRGLLCGLWLGGSVLMAFQCLPIVASVLLVLPLRRCWRRPGHIAGVLAGIALGLLGQALLDRLVYGSFGSALGNYFVSNAGPLVASSLYELGFEDLGRRLYEASVETIDQTATEKRMRYSKTWYLRELTDQALVWPAALLVAVGLAASLRRGAAGLRVVALVALATVVTLSLKGEKSFRLWMPIWPWVALLGGAGYRWLCVAPSGAALRRARRAAGLLALAAVGLLGAGVIARTNLAQYGGYWRAMELVNAQAQPGAEPLRVASGYDWAVRFRERPGVRLTKLAEHLDRWPDLSEERRAAVLEQLEQVDWLIGHFQLFRQDPQLLRLVNRRFEVAAVLDDRAALEVLDPIYVLRTRTGAARARTLYEVYTDTAEGQAHWPPLYQPRIQYPISVDFRRREADGAVHNQLVFLGFDVELGLCSGEQAWITYHWYAGPLSGGNYTVVDRFTDGRGGGYNNNHQPTQGAFPTSQWQPGTIVRESFLTRFSPEAAGFGGAYRRGDLVPVQLYLALAEYDAEDRQVGGLVPFHASGAGPIHRERRPDGTLGSADGRQWSDDALLRVAGFWWPVPDHWRAADDGRPLPGER
jgi:4-amino-4-deoxy-L-arabinose transferase-like glycosyltransferase